MAQVALAWALRSEWVTAPIVGIRSTDRLDELIAGLEVKLTEAELEQISKEYEPLPVDGHT